MPTKVPRVKRRRALPLGKRLQIIAKAESGLSHRAIATELGVNKSSVNFTLQRRKYIAEAAASGVSHDCYRLRPPRNPDLDEDVGTFFHWTRLSGWGCTGALLRNRALRAASRLGVNGFKASNGWLHNFQRKKGICMRGVLLKMSENDVLHDSLDATRVHQDVGFEGIVGTGTRTSFPPTATSPRDTVKTEKAEGRAMHLFRSELDMYSLDNTYTMCETTLFFKSVPDSAAVLCDERDQLVRNGAVPVAKDRVSVIMCANASGSHKLPLVLIGSESRPECFRDRECPLLYFSHKHSWMDGIKARYWCKFFVSEVRKRTTETVLLLMERFMDDKELAENKVKAITIPGRTNRVELPLRAGLTKELKRRYKEQLALKFVQGLENYNELRQDAVHISVGRRGLQYAYPAHMIDAAEILGGIWTGITRAMIAECWCNSNCMRESRLKEFATLTGTSADGRIRKTLGVRTEKDQHFVDKLTERITLLSASFAAATHRSDGQEGAGKPGVDASETRQEVLAYLEEDDQIGDDLGSDTDPEEWVLFQAFEKFVFRDAGPSLRFIGIPDHDIGSFGHFSRAAVDQSLPYSLPEARVVLRDMMSVVRRIQSFAARFDNPLLNGTVRDLLSILSKEGEKYREPVDATEHELDVSPSPAQL